MREILEAFGLVVLVVLMTFVAAASVRLLILLVAVLLGAGCYASHEQALCESDDQCPAPRYCERRLQCSMTADGATLCDPFRGCAWLDDRIDCESPPEGLGLCAPPEARELWR